MCRILRKAGRLSGVCILFLLTLFVNSCIDEELNCFITEENHLVKESIVDRGGGMHLAFPTIVGRSDGTKLLVAYREGRDHISFDGKIIQKESYDKGKTWVNRKVIYEGESGWDARDPQFVLLPDETILCRFFVRTSPTTSTVKYISSDDWGQTYSYSAGEFPRPYRGEVYTAARGNMLVVKDTLYSTAYTRWFESWLLKSLDKGSSWQFVSWIDHATIGNQGYRQLNESSLAVQNDVMYLVARSGGTESRKLHVAQSKDWGSSWENWKELPVYGHAPSLTAYKDIHILSYRNTNTVENENNKYYFDVALFKDGSLYSEPVTILKTSYFDIGYGDAYTFDDFFLLCCYSYDTIHCFKIFYDVFETQ